MPEGDTLHRIAREITVQLGGRTVVEARGMPGLHVEPLAGSTLVTASARGKHLLIDFDSDVTVHSHLGMTGSWHIYPRGERWNKPPQRAAFAARFETHDLVCFSPRTIMAGSNARVRRDDGLVRLGPDLLGETFDVDVALARLRSHDRVPLGEAVMNQQLVAGVGNVYKSEVLFLEHLDPFAPLSRYADEDLVRCLASFRRHMRRNLGEPRRKFRGTTLGDRLWVYRRAELPCLRCETPIAMRRQGEAARSTYFCASCQRVGEERAGTTAR